MPEPSNQTEGGDAPPAANSATPAAGGYPDEFVDMIKKRWAVPKSLSWISWACISLIIHNTAVILSGHLLIRYVIPITPRSFTASSLTSTLAMAALGTAVLAIPVFIAGMVVVGFAFGMKLGSLAVLRTVIHLNHSLRTSRLMPPHPDTFLWQVWMVAAAPIGWLIYENLFPDSEDHLGLAELLITAALPRALLNGRKYAQMAFAPPMPELRPSDALPGVTGHPDPELLPSDSDAGETKAQPEQPSSGPSGASEPIQELKSSDALLREDHMTRLTISRSSSPGVVEASEG